MNFKNILNIIEKEEHYDDYDDYIQDDYDELDENLKRGIFLRDALSEISFIKKFFYKQLNDKGINIDIDDVFLFLKVKKKLVNDYSDLEDEINKNIQKIDYGGYEFISDDKKYDDLKLKIKKLHDEFQKI